MEPRQRHGKQKTIFTNGDSAQPVTAMRQSTNNGAHSLGVSSRTTLLRS